MFSFRRSIADILSQMAGIPSELSEFATRAEARAAKDRANASFYSARSKGAARDARMAREVSRVLSQAFRRSERKPRKKSRPKEGKPSLTLVK